MCTPGCVVFFVRVKTCNCLAGCITSQMQHCKISFDFFKQKKKKKQHNTHCLCGRLNVSTPFYERRTINRVRLIITNGDTIFFFFSVPSNIIQIQHGRCNEHNINIFPRLRTNKIKM